MHVTEFRQKVKPHINLSVGGKEFVIKEVVRFRLDDGSFYTKCFLSDGYVFADDLNENAFLYTAHATAEEIQGEEIFKKGNSERFWDYKAEDGSYLSLGINDKTSERLDFYGRIVANDTVTLE